MLLTLILRSLFTLPVVYCFGSKLFYKCVDDHPWPHITAHHWSNRLGGNSRGANSSCWQAFFLTHCTAHHLVWQVRHALCNSHSLQTFSHSLNAINMRWARPTLHCLPRLSDHRPAQCESCITARPCFLPSFYLWPFFPDVEIWSLCVDSPVEYMTNCVLYCTVMGCGVM